MNPTITTSYEVFLTQKDTKDIVSEILNSVISYDINNNFVRININEKSDKMEKIKSAFFKALVELDVVNSGYLNNKTIDSYLYYLLRNGKIEFVHYNNRYYLKNSTNEHITNDKNFKLELLVNNDAFLKGLHKSWDGKSNYTITDSLMTTLRKKVIELVDTTVLNNLRSPSKLYKFLNWLTFGKIKSVINPYNYRIILNDKQTLVNDMESLEKGFQETFKDVIAVAERASRGEKEITEE